MKWYFASRVRHQQKIVDVANFLDGIGEKVVSNWIKGRSLKPYDQNLKEVQLLAEEVVRSIMDSDIFVLISDPEGTDMFVELGICLNREEARIYIVGKHSRRSLMQLHPRIKHVDTLKEVFDLENIDSEDFNVPLFD